MNVYPSSPVTLSRECQAIQIPSGESVALPAGTQVWVMQSLGGTYTLMTERRQMVRLAGKDADAIGRGPTTAPLAEARPATPEAVEKLVWDQLKTCFDPEIPVNIVDLGLVYHCQVAPLPEGGYGVGVKFTLTAPGCGMGEVLKTDIQNKIRDIPGIKEVAAEVVFDPPWSREMMSEAARLQLGLV
jgi:probable FeS assembly SUF system protein SufT